MPRAAFFDGSVVLFSVFLFSSVSYYFLVSLLLLHFEIHVTEPGRFCTMYQEKKRITIRHKLVLPNFQYKGMFAKRLMAHGSVIVCRARYGQ